jgi:NAD(P)-dependent dehydrogenase (short-subunit alcohol dehydrogenase family)
VSTPPCSAAAWEPAPEGAAHIAGLHPVNRVAQPEEIASLVAYLLSDETTFITGAALTIDGGWTAQ